MILSHKSKNNITLYIMSVDLFELDVPPEGDCLPVEILKYTYPLIKDKWERNCVMRAYYAGVPEAAMWDAFYWLDLHNLSLSKDLRDRVVKAFEDDEDMAELLEDYECLK